MKVSQRYLLCQTSGTFDDLNSLHPIRPIRDKVDLENAYEVMDRLAILSKRTRDQNDHLKMLILITEDYDREDSDSEHQRIAEAFSMSAAL